MDRKEILKEKIILSHLFLIPLIVIFLVIFLASLFFYQEVKSFRKEHTNFIKSLYLSEIKNHLKVRVNSFIKSMEYDLKRGKTLEDIVKKYNSENFISPNYIFVYDKIDLSGGDKFARMLINPNRPDLVGKFISDKVEDLNGVKFRKEMLKQIREKGEAFVEYVYKKPPQNKIVKKISYFKYLPDKRIIVATGTYYDSLYQFLKKEKDAISKKVLKKIKSIFTKIFFLIILGIIILILSLLRAKKLFETYRREIESKAYELKELNIFLQQSLEEHDKIFNLWNPTFLMDKEYQLLKANEPFLRLFSFQRESILNKECHRLFEKIEFKNEKMPADYIIYDNLDEVSDIAKITIGSKKIICEVKLWAFRSKDGNLKGILVSFFDITQEYYRDWRQDKEAEFNNILRGVMEVEEFFKKSLTFFVKVMAAQIGVIYSCDNERGVLNLQGCYGVKIGEEKREFKIGEGVLGEVAKGKEYIILNDVSESFLEIKSGLGKSVPKNILVFPFIYNGVVKAIIEIASLYEFEEFRIDFLKMISSNYALMVHTVFANFELTKLLQEKQEQAKLLEQEREKLKKTNDELQIKTLELEKNRKEVEERNRILETLKQELEEKAQELERASRYKSEFLANMSHELRTPLNSIIILSQILIDEEKAAFDEKQKEFLKTIYSSGKDLLNLINDILDIAKIEAGRVELIKDKFSLRGFVKELQNKWEPIAREKGLSFKATCEEMLPDIMYTDKVKLEQVIRNLVGNALKFTPKGSVGVNFKDWEDKLLIEVVDTGIGIPKEKQELIFEAFKQVDGKINRKYGGTGLGLAICKKIITLMKGKIKVESEEGKGSKFLIYLPKKEIFIESEHFDLEEEIIVKDDKNNKIIKKEKQFSVLIVEDDSTFSNILKQVCESQGIKNVFIAPTGEKALKILSREKIDLILLDFGLPDMDGMELLKILKSNSDYQKIPVYIISGMVDDKEVISNFGVIGILEKPVTKEEMIRMINFITNKYFIKKKILLVEDDKNLSLSLKEYLEKKGLEVVVAQNGKEAIKYLTQNIGIDFLILDLGLPDMRGESVLSFMEENNIKLDVLIYTGEELDFEKYSKLTEKSLKIVLKKNPNSFRKIESEIINSNYEDKETVSNPLSEEVTSDEKEREKKGDEEKNLFLVEGEVIRDGEIESESEYQTEFPGKKVLLVDDDVRNIFATTSMLETFKLEVDIAKNGKEAIDKFEEGKYDLMILDLMMPEMDGYQVLEELKGKRKTKVPIIVFTAKAMKGEKEKVYKLGADGFITKPLEKEKLLVILTKLLKD